MLSYEYIAGFFDGEGNISLEVSGEGCYGLRLTFTNTNKEVLEEIQKVVGGYLGFRDNKSKPCWKDRGQLRLRVVEISRELPHFYPFLLIKKPVATLALDYIKEFEIKGKRTPEQKERQRWYVERFKELNARGKNVEL